MPRNPCQLPSFGCAQALTKNPALRESYTQTAKHGNAVQKSLRQQRQRHPIVEPDSDCPESQDQARNIFRAGAERLQSTVVESFNEL